MKKLDLNALGVEEMDIRELKQQEGGLAFLAAVGAGILIAAATNIINHWDDFKLGLSGGY